MKTKRDVVVRRLAMLCILAGLPPLAWFDMTATEFMTAVRRKAMS